MITKEEFIDLIQNYLDWDKQIDKVNECLHTNVLEQDWIEYSNVLFSKTISLIFTEAGEDDIDWWLYEKQQDSTLNMKAKDGTIIPTETIEDLWELVKNKQR